MTLQELDSATFSTATAKEVVDDVKISKEEKISKADSGAA